MPWRALSGMVPMWGQLTADEHPVTAMHAAARSGHADAIEFLARNGADVRAVDDYLCTPLHDAAMAKLVVSSAF